MSRDENLLKFSTLQVLTLAFFVLWAPLITWAQGPKIFEIPAVKRASYQYKVCAEMLGSGPSSSSVTVENIIGFADKEFTRRGWSEEFMAERIRLARDFPNSEYFYTKQNGEIVGVIAASYAEYSGEFSSRDRLPMEASLHLPPLRRPVDSQGRGLITEMRTYAIQGQHPRDIRSTLALGALSWVVEKYKPYPELIDQPVIYTYGDETSLRLYGSMGFTNLSEEWGLSPIVHAGSQWWILGTTPRQIQSLIRAEVERFSRFAKGGTETATLPNGRKARFGGDLNQSIEDGKKTIETLAFLAEETEIDEGLWAARNAILTYSPEGRLESVSQISRPYRIPGTDIIARAGYPLIFFTQTGRPRVIESVDQAFQIVPDIWVREGERVEWLPDGDYGRISWDFYNPKLKRSGSTWKPKRSLKRPKLVPSYIGYREVEDEDEE